MDVLRRIPYLTLTAGLISIFVSLAMWRTAGCDAPCFYSFGGGDIEFIYAGGYWKIFTASFLHIDLPHLIGNLVFLWFFGSRLELEFGRRVWLILYLVSEFVARLSVGVVAGLSSVGISGFIFGMAGFLLVADWRESLWATLISRKVYIFFLIFIGMTIFPPPEFLSLPAPGDAAHEAHITGFVEGLLLGNFILRRQTVWAGLAVAVLPLAALSTLLYFPSSFWWQMAKDNEREVLAWQNIELLSCDAPNASGTPELPKYSPVIINPARTSYSVISLRGDSTPQPSELFIIDYETLTVHTTPDTSAKYANLGDSYLGQIFEIRDAAGNCLGRFRPEHEDYNILVLK
jgi:membrane associated rhomboid family serine protease